jgi:hypothetical protein
MKNDYKWRVGNNLGDALCKFQGDIPAFVHKEQEAETFSGQMASSQEQIQTKYLQIQVYSITAISTRFI